MQYQKKSSALLLAALSLAFALPAAAIHVDPITATPGSTPLVLDHQGLERVEFVNTSYTRIDKFTVAHGGRYELTLTDLLFPAALRKLGAAVTSADHKLVDVFGSGNALFDVAPGMYYLSVYAKTFTNDEPGLFGWSLRPTETAAVPLPATLWLFGSGLIGFVGLARRERTVRTW